MIDSNSLLKSKLTVSRAPFEPGKQPYKLAQELMERPPENVFSHGPSSPKLIALTFDDGPDSLFLPAMLDIFEHYDVKVTFFCLGRCIHQNPDMIKHIAQAGHVIGNHTYDHFDITKLTPEQVSEQIERTEAEIFQIIGLRPALFRPPYGFFDAASTRIVVSLGYKIILWSIDSLDWVGLTGPAITARVIPAAQPGAIVLMHNACSGSVESGTGTTQSLPYIIEILKAEGYLFTTVSTMLNIPAYK
jgi:peptidoglycan/xylan/chitin deacetylase (PgdA/CDA1 family)